MVYILQMLERNSEKLLAGAIRNNEWPICNGWSRIKVINPLLFILVYNFFILIVAQISILLLLWGFFCFKLDKIICYLPKAE